MKKGIILALSLSLAVGVIFTGCSSQVAAGIPAVSQAQASTQSTLLSLAEARKIALTHAGESEDNVSFTQTELVQNEAGVSEYSVVMNSSAYTYTYKIDAYSGKILNSSAVEIGAAPIVASSEVVSQASAVTSQAPAAASQAPVAAATSAPAGNATTGDIGAEKAKQIALDHAGVQAANVVFVKVQKDYEHGYFKYEVEFYSGNTEYDYDIHGTTGAVLSYDYDAENYAPVQQGSGDIGLASAKQIALGRVSGATDNNIRIYKEYDDGRFVYEGEIIYNATEYEFKIDASTGTVLEWEAESVYS